MVFMAATVYPQAINLLSQMVTPGVKTVSNSATADVATRPLPVMSHF